ncbi:C-type lectin 37Db-like [Drosophila subpulchrella]|uniref:C-type lectin 37Db-like n=1 Tax=Drosophila subpulchrella TaxID=1486046 RepID=UPI0018A151E9|nr:C-type lectin 37Db-like [Drosophila subpulchrella]
MPSIIQEELKGGHKEMPESRDQIKIVSNESLDSIPPGFEKIGSRYFYIEEQINTDWPDARNICQEKGGYLAAIQNQEEFDAVVLKLKENNRYWLGINDRIVEGVYISEASGKRAPFLKWFAGDPDNRDNYENCVGIALSKGMADWPCRFAFNFICSLDNYV